MQPLLAAVIAAAGKLFQAGRCFDHRLGDLSLANSSSSSSSSRYFCQMSWLHGFSTWMRWCLWRQATVCICTGDI